MWDTPIFNELRREIPVVIPSEEKETMIEVRVIKGDTVDEWFTLPAVPREGDFFSRGPGMEADKVKEVYWLPLGTTEQQVGHVAVFLEDEKPGGKKPHPWKSR